MLLIQRLVPMALTGALLCLPAAARAAQPANDTFAGARPIAALPFSDTGDTTEATLDADDQAVGAACGLDPSSFVASNSVWYAYTPAADETVAIDTAGSSYAVAGAVVSGAPGAFTAAPGGCFLSSALVTLTAGTTYYLDLVQFGAGDGGTLQLSLTRAVPPELTVAVDDRGTFSRAGMATITGTATCSEGASAFVATQLTQMADNGRLAAITGFAFGGPLVCDGTPHEWSLAVTPQSGRFRGGPASVALFSSACSFTCATVARTETVRLRR
jgi:hypothetical protein